MSFDVGVMFRTSRRRKGINATNATNEYKGDLIMIGNEYSNLPYKPEIKPQMLRYIRLSRNITQTTVAAKLGVSQKMISDYENGKYEDFSPNVYARVRELVRAYRIDRYEIESYKKLMEIKARRGYKV